LITRLSFADLDLDAGDHGSLNASAALQVNAAEVDFGRGGI
jgi:hypothetical protein